MWRLIGPTRLALRPAISFSRLLLFRFGSRCARFDAAGCGRFLHSQELGGIGFEEVVFTSNVAICSTSWSIPNPNRYAHQRIVAVRREDSVCLVPFVEDEETVFLKTIISSRKALKEYLGEESDNGRLTTTRESCRQR